MKCLVREIKDLASSRQTSHHSMIVLSHIDNRLNLGTDEQPRPRVPMGPNMLPAIHSSCSKGSCIKGG